MIPAGSFIINFHYACFLQFIIDKLQQGASEGFQRCIGTDERNIYSGLSYGVYINILADGVYVLDYAPDVNSNLYVAIAKRIDYNGRNVIEPYR